MQHERRTVDPVHAASHALRQQRTKGRVVLVGEWQEVVQEERGSYAEGDPNVTKPAVPPGPITERLRDRGLGI